MRGPPSFLSGGVAPVANKLLVLVIGTSRTNKELEMTATATAAKIAASIKKGDVLTNKAGHKLTVIQSKTQHQGNGEYVVMVRPEVGRGFDLFYNVESFERGAENGGYSKV